jgi:hypothetical protein
MNPSKMMIQLPCLMCTNFSRETGFPVFAYLYYAEKDVFYIVFARGYRGCPEEFSSKTVACAGVQSGLHVARGGKFKAEANHDWLVRIDGTTWLPLEGHLAANKGQPMFVNPPGGEKGPWRVVPTLTPIPLHREPPRASQVPYAEYLKASPYDLLGEAFTVKVPFTVMLDHIGFGEYHYGTVTAVSDNNHRKCVVLPFKFVTEMFCDPALPARFLPNPAAAAKARWFLRAGKGLWVPLEAALCAHRIRVSNGRKPLFVFAAEGAKSKSTELFKTSIRGPCRPEPPNPLNITYQVLPPSALEDQFIKDRPELGVTWGQRVASGNANPFFGVGLIAAETVIGDNDDATILPPPLQRDQGSDDPKATCLAYSTGAHDHQAATAARAPPCLPSALMASTNAESTFLANREELLSWEAQIANGIEPNGGLKHPNFSFEIHFEHPTVATPMLPREALVKALPPRVPFDIHAKLNFSAFTAEASFERCERVRLATETVSAAAEKMFKKGQEESDDLIHRADRDGYISPPHKKQRK